jgi:hypothetical protein
MIDCLDLDLDQVQERERKIGQLLKQWADAEEGLRVDLMTGANALERSAHVSLSAFKTDIQNAKINFSPVPTTAALLKQAEIELNKYLTDTQRILNAQATLPPMAPSPDLEDVLGFLEVMGNWHDVASQLVQESEAARNCDQTLTAVGGPPLVLPIPPVKQYTFAELEAFLEGAIHVVQLIQETGAPQPSESDVRDLLGNLRTILDDGKLSPQTGTTDPRFDVPNLVLIDRKISELVDALTALVGDRNLLDYSIP